MNERPLSIKEISELSGVSVATVSRVINHNGRFSKETEERVLSVIKEYQYVPNMVARGLRRSASQIVGVIVPDITNEFFAKIVQSIQIKLFESHYSAVICDTNENQALEVQHLQFLKAQNVSGMIFISGNPSHSTQAESVPTVYIDRRPKGDAYKNAMMVESDNIQGGYLAGKALLDAGARRIVTLMDSRMHTAGETRYLGWKLMMEEAGVPVIDHLQLSISEIGFQAAHDAICKLLDSGATFDGVFCGTDWLAVGTLAALHERGLHVPSQVKVVGFDDVSIAQFSSKPITTIHQDTQRMGAVAVDMLLKAMNGERIDTPHCVLGVEVMHRATTACDAE